MVFHIAFKQIQLCKLTSASVAKVVNRRVISYCGKKININRSEIVQNKPRSEELNRVSILFIIKLNRYLNSFGQQ